MIRLRPVVTRQWIEEQGIYPHPYTAEQLKRQQYEHSDDTASTSNGNHVTADEHNGSSEGDSGQKVTLRPCQCRMTATLPPATTAAVESPVHPGPSLLSVASPATVADESKASPGSPSVHSPVTSPSPSTASVTPLSSFPASSLASLPSSTRSSRSHKVVLPAITSTSSPSVPPVTTPLPAIFDSSAASHVSNSSSSANASSLAQSSEWSDEESVSRLPPPYSKSSWPLLRSHVLHILDRDDISRSTFASQIHVSLSIVNRVFSGRSGTRRQYRRMRVWAWRKDEDYVRRKESERQPGALVTEADWEEWQALTMELERRQTIDYSLLARDMDVMEGEEARAMAEKRRAEAGERASQEGDSTDVSMDTDEERAKEELSMDVDSNGADHMPTVADEPLNTKGTRNGGRRNSRSRRRSPALRASTTNSHASVTPSSLASLPSSSSSSPSPISAAGSSPATTSALVASSTASPAPSTAPPITASSPVSSSSSSLSSPAASLPSFLLSSLPTISSPYFTSADAIIDRLDFYILQLRLSQKTLAHLTTVPLTTISQLIRRVYKPWPTDEQPLSTNSTGSSGVFVVVVALLWWLDGMVSGVVRGRVSNVHDTCNLAFLSSLTVSGLSRERLNVWLDGKTVNPLHDRQWIDEIAIKEFGVTQETVVREWEKVRGAAATVNGTTEVVGGSGG